MKRFNLLQLITLILLLSCGKTDTKNIKTETPKTHSENPKIRQTIAVTDSFFQITNISGAMIDFKKGPLAVIAEGDSSTLSHLSYEFDSGILTISSPIDKSNDIKTYPTQTDAVVHVSCPSLKAVAICSGGGFRNNGVLKTESIQFGGMVGGSINVDSIVCDLFRYDNSGSTTSNFNNINCKECIVCSTGNGTISMNINSSVTAYFDISGSTTIKSTICSPEIKSIVDNNATVSYDIETKMLYFRALQGTISLNGHAEEKQITTSNQVTIHNSLK